MTNLTVRMEVLSVDAEGEYICEFESEEEYYTNSVFLSIVGKSCCMLMAPEYAWIFIFETLLTSGVIWLSAPSDITIGHQGAFEGFKKEKRKMCIVFFHACNSKSKKCISTGKSDIFVLSPSYFTGADMQ